MLFSDENLSMCSAHLMKLVQSSTIYCSHSRIPSESPYPTALSQISSHRNYFKITAPSLPPPYPLPRTTLSTLVHLSETYTYYNFLECYLHTHASLTFLSSPCPCMIPYTYFRHQYIMLHLAGIALVERKQKSCICATRDWTLMNRMWTFLQWWQSEWLIKQSICNSADKVNSATKINTDISKHFTIIVGEYVQYDLCFLCLRIQKIEKVRKFECDMPKLVIWLKEPPSAHSSSWQLQRTKI